MRLLLRNSSSSRESRVRKIRLIACGLTALVVVCFAGSVRAVDPNRAISQYLWEHWGSESGLVGGVTSIAQTPDGYLWVGTEEGLFRFDGLSFLAFPQAIPTSLAIGPVQELVADSAGNLWILLKNTTILRYRDGKFEVGREEAAAGITSAIRRRDGTILLSSLALGAMTYHEERFEVLTSPDEPTSSKSTATQEIEDEQSSRLSWATGVTPHRYAEPNSAVLSMAETRDGKVWLGTQDKGLFYLSQGRVFPAGKLATITEIHSLLAFENGDLWIGTDRGVMRWNGTEITSEQVPPALRHAQILSMIRDRDSNFWVGTADRLVRVSPDRTTVEEDTSRMTSAVTALFEDREGNIWVGSSHGLDRLRDSAFVTYSVAGLQSESSGPVYVDQDERTWFAPIEGGLHWLKGEAAGSVTLDGLARDVVYSIAGSKDDLWIGRQEGGLTHLHHNGGSFTAKTYTEHDGLAQNSVYSVYLGRDGSVWAGTLSGGVSEFLNGHFKTYTAADGISSNTVGSIAETSEGVMWFATPNGLSSLANGRWRVWGRREGLPSEEVNCVVTDSSGVLWIGTASGLAWFDSGRIRTPSEVPASLHEQILGIGDDRKGRLWIATSDHVLRVSRAKLLSGSLTADDVRDYGLADGLHGTEGVKRHQSVFTDTLGRVWFSMNRGISVVEPVRATSDSAPVLAQIQLVSADGAAIEMNGSIRLPPGRQRIKFSYIGLSLSAPERVRYRYRLDGFDRGWSEPVTTRDAIYTNLGPGSYRFRVIASNSDGIWNENGPSLRFYIAPEFYQTKWFLFLCLLAAAGIAWAAYQRHILQMTARMDLQFKERLSERTRIARELHDTLLQSFQGSMLHFQRARNLLPSNPSEAIQRLDTALEGAEQAIVEGRNAIHDIRTSALVDDDLARAVTGLGVELRAKDPGQDGAKLNVVMEGTAKPLDPVLRDEVYRIVREAVRNAFTHAEAQHIEAEIAYGEKLLRVRIRDDGKGLDPKVLDEGKRAGHWGLPGMHERAKRIGGELDVWSEVGAGTEIELTVPGSLAYRNYRGQSPFRKKKGQNR